MSPFRTESSFYDVIAMPAPAPADVLPVTAPPQAGLAPQRARMYWWSRLVKSSRLTVVTRITTQKGFE